MKRFGSAYTAHTEDVVFRPALAPMEAAMLPAEPARGRGALALARASFAPGRRRGLPQVALPRLAGWGISARRSASDKRVPER